MTITSVEKGEKWFLQIEVKIGPRVSLYRSGPSDRDLRYSQESRMGCQAARRERRSS